MTITRGPWEWGSGENELVIRPQGIPEDNEAFVIAVLPMESYEHLEDWSESGWSAEGEANARLIAAAPEMKEWITKMREAIIEGNADAISVLFTTGRSLLRRIEGEEETE